MIPEQIDWIMLRLEVQGAPAWQRQLCRHILELPTDIKVVLDTPPTHQVNVAPEIAKIIEALAYPDIYVMAGDTRDWNEIVADGFERVISSIQPWQKRISEL